MVVQPHFSLYPHEQNVLPLLTGYTDLDGLLYSVLAPGKVTWQVRWVPWPWGLGTEERVVLIPREVKIGDIQEKIGMSPSHWHRAQSRLLGHPDSRVSSRRVGRCTWELVRKGEPCKIR